METYSYIDDQDDSATIESVRDRLQFLTAEWSLILGWICTYLLIWRVTVVAVIERYLPLHTMRFAIIGAVLLLMTASVCALTMTGRWLRKRPQSHSLWQRWRYNGITMCAVAALGRLIIWYFMHV